MQFITLISAVAFLALVVYVQGHINDIAIPHEKIAEVIVAQAEQHCQALNSSDIDSTGRRKRDTDSSRENIRRTVLQILSDCLASQEVTTPTPIPDQTTTIHPDVANGPCTSPLTVNLTGSWRKDREGSDLKPVAGYYNCDRDLQGNTQWFRFTGDGGRQLSDRCAPAYSCGAHGNFWSNAAMPTEIGEVKTVPIYGSWSGSCNWYTWPVDNPLTVQRCSDREGDFVYSVRGTSSCYWSFCGMD